MFRTIVSFIIRIFRCLLYSQLCTKSCKRVQLQLDTFARLCTLLDTMHGTHSLKLFGRCFLFISFCYQLLILLGIWPGLLSSRWALNNLLCRLCHLSLLCLSCYMCFRSFETEQLACLCQKNILQHFGRFFNADFALHFLLI